MTAPRGLFSREDGPLSRGRGAAAGRGVTAPLTIRTGSSEPAYMFLLVPLLPKKTPVETTASIDSSKHYPIPCQAYACTIDSGIPGLGRPRRCSLPPLSLFAVCAADEPDPLARQIASSRPTPFPWHAADSEDRARACWALFRLGMLN